MAPIQRDGMEYEFTVMLDIDMNHVASTSKDRTRIFDGTFFKVSEDTGRTLLAWLETGKEEQPATETEKIDESAIADHKAAIESAESLNALFRAFSAAYRAATTVKDLHALAIFTDAKEARKATLEQYGEQA
jgi:hypothetical protein